MELKKYDISSLHKKYFSPAYAAVGNQWVD